MCFIGIHECTTDDDTNRETTGEGPGLQKQPGKKNRESVDKRITDEVTVEVEVKESFKQIWRRVFP